MKGGRERERERDGGTCAPRRRDVRNQAEGRAHREGGDVRTSREGDVPKDPTGCTAATGAAGTARPVAMAASATPEALAATP